MSFLTFVAGDLFRITVRKYLAANPERKWDNNYEFRAVTNGLASDLVALGNVLVSFESQLHYAAVQFDLVRISTWEEDSTPYDPETFMSFPLSVAGAGSMDGIQLLALNNCWDVARFPTSGRFGHIYYRGCLPEVQVVAPAGKSVLADTEAKDSELNLAVTTSGLNDYMDGEGVVLEMVMINKTGTQVRQIINLVSRGVAVVPFNHAWFNRTTSP